MQLTQQQLDTNNLNLRAKHIRLELLDFDMNVVDTIEGDAIGGSITFNANDDIRRSGTIEIAIPLDKSAANFLDTIDGYSIELGGKIWLDKYVKVFVGIEDYTKTPTEIVWYNKGVYLIDQPIRSYNSTQFTISFNIIDLMAKLTGLRQGQLTGQSVVFESDQIVETDFVRVEMAEVLPAIIEELGGFTKYSIYPIPQKYKYQPYPINVGVGSTVYDILKQFMDILSNWQMYFDNDGILIIEPIPSGENDMVYPIEYEQLITNELSVDFQNVKNQIVIYGKLNSTTYYTANAIYTGGYLTLTYDSLTPANFTILGTSFGFLSPSNYNDSTLTAIKIYDKTVLIATASFVVFEGYNSTTQEKTYVPDNGILPNQIYIVKILDASLNTSQQIDFSEPIVMELYSKQQVSECIVNDNKESPFYINANLSGENYYCGTAQTNGVFNVGENYALTLNDSDNAVISLSNGTIITFMANYANTYASGFNFTSVTVYSTNGNLLVQDIPIVQKKLTASGSTYERLPIAENKIIADYTIWELQYDSQNSQFVFLGRYPYAITKVLSGGEYDVIYADRLAYERCVWELYLSSSLNNNIKLGLIPNYNLDVNIKIPYNESWALPQDVSDWVQYEVQTSTQGQTQDYDVKTQSFYVKSKNKDKYFLIKSVTFPLGIDNTPQSIEAIEIYRDKNLVGSDYED